MSDIKTAELPFPDRFGEGRTDVPSWNESAWFSFSVPERGIHGLAQHLFRPNMKLLNGGPIVWDAKHRFQHDCLFYDWAHLQAMPKDAAKFDFTAPNSYSVTVLEPLTRYRLAYDNHGFVMDLEWTASAPPHGFDNGGDVAGHFHMDQPGHVRGYIVLNGERLEVDCPSIRDCSYGPREYGKMPSGGYFWATGEDRAFQAICMGKGRRAKCIGGFLMQNGEMADIVSGQREVIEYDEYGPSKVRFEAEDAKGRALSITGKMDPGLVFTGYTTHTVLWAMTRWDWDGQRLLGDNQEFTPAERFRQIARGELAPDQFRD